ncbi:hypothetical protein TRFO_25417 [Tritrichomonas foetus]|uniref:KATNIP domain-containing protein n=1 Tax=Tritrichomonas foetus TaxID=1144522 RepID=A0A1J4KA13_9EUKA|nr:hypothetical protein TRFO_25417 [Tritrichomonas foetus]|eukprot:OHT06532.1 hypothetical protein TRFO_25417 [Tritrichomonas foetus]
MKIRFPVPDGSPTRKIINSTNISSLHRTGELNSTNGRQINSNTNTTINPIVNSCSNAGSTFNYLTTQNQTVLQSSKKLSRAYSNASRREKRSYEKKLSRLRAVSHVPRSMPAAEFDLQITIQFISNWGNSNTITCSEVDFLTGDRIPVSNVRVSFGNKLLNTPENLNHLQKLCNKTLVKVQKDCWSFPFNQQLRKLQSKSQLELVNFKNDYVSQNIFNKLNKGYKNNFVFDGKIENHENYKSLLNEVSYDDEPLSIVFSLITDRPPEFVRIWNGKLEPATQLKDFKVLFNDKTIYKGEVPCQFGVNAAILIETDQIHPKLSLSKLFFNENKDSTDNFGVLPIPSTTKLEIDMISNFTIHDKRIGLNCIQFFGINGCEIPISEIRTVTVKGATSIFSPYRILKDKRRTIDEKEMWIAEKYHIDDIVKLIVTFAHPEKIVMIRVWNYNGEDYDIGVKKARITIDGLNVWNGCFKKAKGMTTKIVDFVTDIWLAEKEIWKEYKEIKDPPTTRSLNDQSCESNEIKE